MKATLKNYHQSPRKVRLVAALMKGKKVTDAIAELGFVNKRASLTIRKAIESAAANAVTNFNQKKEDLYIKELTVDKGMVMKRFIPGARGTAYPIKKRMSHICVVLDIKSAKEPKVKKVKNVKKTEVAATVAAPKVAKKKVAKKVKAIEAK